MKKIMAVLLSAALMTGAAAAEGNKADILKVERRLYELGYRDENCDGQMDDATVSALKNFQTANGLKVTGEADDATVDLLMSDAAMPEQAYLETYANVYSGSAVLAWGDYGDDVKKLQNALKQLGYFSGECNGTYGDGTETAVYSFQLAVGVQANGVADGSTQMRLYESEAPAWDDFIASTAAKSGDSGSNVRMLQMRLKRLGYFQGDCTGTYGEGTQAAVKNFQIDNALDGSGVANEATCRILYSNRAAVTNATLNADREGLSDDVREMLDELRALNYPAGDTLNAHTEIAVMQFQLCNGIAVTGALDAQTQETLKGGAAKEMTAEVEPAAAPEQIALVSRIADALLGRKLEFEAQAELGMYVYLKAGVPVMSADQMQMTEISDTADIQAGDVVMVEVSDAQVYGVATADGAIIYCGADGYVVMSYLDMISDARILHWRVPEAEA